MKNHHATALAGKAQCEAAASELEKVDDYRRVAHSLVYAAVQNAALVAEYGHFHSV